MRSLIPQTGISRQQFLIFGVCWLLVLLEGFDTLAIAYTAPSIASDWGVPHKTLGALLSAGVIGMILGGFTVAPVCDRIGRRPIILLCVFGISIVMGLTAVSTSVNQLFFFRVLTGIGVGGIMPAISALAAEFSPDHRRNLVIASVNVAFPIGGMIGGIVSAVLISQFGWRSVYVVGGVLTLMMAVLAAYVLPESLHFLVTKNPPNALDRFNTILARIGQRTVDALPSATAELSSAAGIRALFAGTLLTWTPLLWICLFVNLFGVYLLSNWLPKIVVDAGLPLEKAIFVGVANNLGGVFGMLFLGHLSSAWGLRPIVASFLFLAAVFTVLFGIAGAEVWLLMGISVILGFFTLGAFIGSWASAVALYPTAYRATGVGWGAGIGRIGACLGPYAAGVLLGFGWGRETFFAVISIPFLIGAVAMGFLRAPELQPPPPRDLDQTAHLPESG